MARTRFMNKKQAFPVNDGSTLSRSLQFIEESLGSLGIDRKLSVRTMLLAEEIIVHFMGHAPADSTLRIRVRRLFGDAELTISAPGTEADLNDAGIDAGQDLSQLGDEDVFNS